MRQYLPILLSICIIAVIGWVVVNKKNQVSIKKEPIENNTFGRIQKKDYCQKYGNFFQEKGIIPPVTVDLSQKQYKGVALYYGDNQVYHPRSWERFGYFETYTVDKRGNLYLIPMPFISIEQNTFKYLKNLYKIDTDSGKLLPFFHFDDVYPSSNNPFGLKSVAYDCDNDTLWVSAIDESDYTHEKGVIYHIDLNHKKILSKLEGWDALSLAIVKSDSRKFLFFGSARESALYAVNIDESTNVSNPIKLFDIPDPQEHIRKIKVLDINELEIQTIPFTYTLITESSKEERNFYHVLYNDLDNEWYITKK